MTSKAKEHKPHGKSSKTAPIQVSSFVELTAALNQAPELAGFQFEVPMDGVVSLQKDDITLIFFEDRAWQDAAAVSVFLSKANDSGLCFICTGAEGSGILARHLGKCEFPFSFSAMPGSPARY